ncbi:MAG: HAD-IC family P-type ATPase [Patescibacteria group bacterium]
MDKATKLTDILSKKTLQQPFWSIEARDVLESLHSKKTGLTQAESEGRLALFGKNEITGIKRRGKIRIITSQFKSPLILALTVAGVITLFLHEWIDAGVILIAVAINTALGFWQENKAENVLDELKSYIRTRARVRRSDQEHEIDASELVPGDVIRLTQGDRVPADARILYANNLEIDESILTGESLPSTKNEAPLPPQTPLGDRDSMVMGGTMVIQGIADALVIATGDVTEFGRIAKLATGEIDEPTPLQKAVSRFATASGIILCLAALLIFFIGFTSGYSLLDMFVTTVAITVSAVPEGLPIALTVILAVGVERLAKRKGIVKKLLAAETLGSTTLILTDKTGTLTQAKMQLSSIIIGSDTDASMKKQLLSDAVMNTDVIIENKEDTPAKWQVHGKPLEVALVNASAEKGIFPDSRLKNSEILDRLPFDSSYKYSMVLLHENKKTTLYSLGAPEILLEHCHMDNNERIFWQSQIEKSTSSGERVLGLAYKDTKDSFRLTSHEKISDLTFQGLITFRDPLRPGVKEVIKKIAKAGVKTVIVTGDHPGTAKAVAHELGLLSKDGLVITGDELTFLGDDKLIGELARVSVFARVTPEQKLMLAKAYQKLGEVVAVTGDGVNDAPALRAADIGIAVGSGTEVAKSAADLIILNDDFETIVAAIEEGKRVMNNIRKVIVYLLTDAFDEIFLIGGALLTGLAMPINALQILFVNMFSDSFPAIAFAFEKNSDLSLHEPLNLKNRILNPEMRFMIFVIGSLTSTVLFALYYTLIKLGYDSLTVKTFIYMGFASYTLLAAFSLRSLSKSIFAYNPFSNFYLTLGVAFGLLLTVISVYVPFFNKVLDTTPLPPLWLFAVLAVSVFNVLGIELGKWLYGKKIKVNRRAFLSTP